MKKKVILNRKKSAICQNNQFGIFNFKIEFPMNKLY